MPNARMRETDADLDTTGFLKRRALRIKQLGIVAIGKIVPPPANRLPTGGDDAAEAQSRAAVRRAHREVVLREIDILEKRIAELDARIAAANPAVDMPELAEARAERRMLCQLRADVIAEQDAPIMTDRDGRPVDERARRFIAGTARFRAEQNWEAAERAAAAGDHREARMRRVNAYRGRHLAEFEAGLRSSLPGFTSPWT